MANQVPQGAPFPGADDVDAAAEGIIPPEQAPMDDAAGGPQADRSDAPLDDSATGNASTEELTVQGGE